MISSISEIARLWDLTLKRVEQKLGDRQTFDSFFAGTYINEIYGNRIQVIVEKDLARAVLNTKYIQMVTDIVNDITEDTYEVEFVSSKEIGKLERKEPKGFSPQQNKETPFFSDSFLDPSLTFDSYVVGQFNKEVYHAAKVVAENPGIRFNPFFLYSHSGLGKTHLMHAVGNYIKEKNPATKVLLISAQAFVEEYIGFVTGEKDADDLATYLKGIDVLMIDDVQNLASREKSQDFLFTIYNWMIAHKKQVVVSSDRQPNELEKIQDRLITRFSQGLVIKINEPDQESCVEILKKKIQERGMNINDFDPSVLILYAEKFSKSIRDLEGALNRLTLKAEFLGENYITMDIAIEAAEDILGGKQVSTQLNGQKIINTVADYYKLEPSQITGKTRTSQLVLARHICMYLMRYMLTEISLKQIGSLLGGKDHTTVMSGISNVEKGLKTDEALKQAIEEIQNRLKP